MLPDDKKIACERLVFKKNNRLADYVNDDMVRRGVLWSQNDKKVDFYSLRNYHQLRIALGALTVHENAFFTAFTRAPFYAVHCTDTVNMVNKDGDLIMYSRRELINKGVRFNTGNTQLIDISALGNDDYVFFSLEIGEELQKTSSRFGSIFHKVAYSHPVFRNSSLVLTDQIALVKPTNRISGLSQAAQDILNSRGFNGLSIFFNGKMMSVLGLAYHILFDTRRLPKADQQIVLSARLPSELSTVMNSFFRPEVRVPKRVSIKSEDFVTHMEHYRERAQSFASSDSDDWGYNVSDLGSDSEG